MKPPRWAVYAAPVALYFALSLPVLRRPAVMFEEGAGFAKALAIARGACDDFEEGWSFLALGRRWPLMRYDYIGTQDVYGDLPFVWLGGGRPEIARLSFVLVGAITLLAFLSLARRHFDDETALVAGLLLAAQPAFTMVNRNGSVYDEFYLTFFIISGLWAWARRPFLCGLLWGLAWWARPAAFWYYAPAALLLLRWRPKREVLLSAGLGWLIGAAIPLAHALSHRGRLFLMMWRHLWRAHPSADNLRFLGNLALRLSQVPVELSGGPSRWEVSRFPPADTAAWGLLLGYALALAAWRHPPEGARRKALWVLCVLPPLLLLESCFTLSGYYHVHLTSALPFMILAAAAGWAGLRESPRLRGRGRLAAGIAVATILASELRFDWDYLRRLRAGQGLNLGSNAVYELTDYLKARGITRPVCLSQESYYPLVYLSELSIRPERSYWQDGLEPDRLATLRTALRERRPFLYYAPRHYRYRERESDLAALRRQAEAERRPLDVEAEFRDAAGEPVFVLYAARSGA